jgi:hypothetical protein
MSCVVSHTFRSESCSDFAVTVRAKSAFPFCTGKFPAAEKDSLFEAFARMTGLSRSCEARIVGLR